MAPSKRNAKQMKVLIGILFVLQSLLMAAQLFAYLKKAVLPSATQSATVAPSSAERPQVTLNSQAPYHQVVIPFRMVNGQIVASVRLNTQMTDCAIDTGCRDILWSGLPIDGLHSPKPYSTILWRHKLAETGIYLNSMEMGDLTLHNPFSMRLHTVPTQPIYVIIGNYAFQHTILTIDYPHRFLILRDTSYDITRLPLSSRDALADIDFDPGYAAYPEFGPSRIYVRMQVEGHETHMCVDTGYHGGIALPPDFRRRLDHLPADYRLTHPTQAAANAKTVAQTKRPLHWTLNNLSGQAAGDVLDQPLIGVDEAVIGYAALKDYCMTIDYTRKKMLFEYIGSPSGTHVTTKVSKSVEK